MVKKVATIEVIDPLGLNRVRNLQLLTEVDYISITKRNPEDVSNNLKNRRSKKICNSACYPKDLRSHCWSHKALEEMRVLVAEGLLQELDTDSKKLPSFRVTDKGHLYIDNNGVLPGQTS